MRSCKTCYLSNRMMGSSHSSCKLDVSTSKLGWNLNRCKQNSRRKLLKDKKCQLSLNCASRRFKWSKSQASKRSGSTRSNTANCKHNGRTASTIWNKQSLNLSSKNNDNRNSVSSLPRIILNLHKT